MVGLYDKSDFFLIDTEVASKQNKIDDKIYNKLCCCFRCEKWRELYERHSAQPRRRTQKHRRKC